MGLWTPGRLLVGAALVALVLSALSLFGDVRHLSRALTDFAWPLAAPVLGLTVAGYVVRFARWQLYLRCLGVPPLGTATSALVFGSGFSMAVTPGKMGEVIKAVLLRRLTSTPVGRTTAIVVAERITDVLGMLVLASIGLVSFPYGRPFIALAAAVTLVLVLLLRRPALLASWTRGLERLPGVGRKVHHATPLLRASGELLGPRPLAVGLGLGVVAWGCECIAFAIVLAGLGVPFSGHLVLAATFVLASSTLLGAVSMLPGGLGVAEAGLVGMLLLLLPRELDRGTAAAATLLIRFATLWFGMLLGLAALLALRRSPAWRGASRAIPVPGGERGEP